MRYEIKRIHVISNSPEKMEIEPGWEPFAVIASLQRPMGVMEAWTIWLRRVIAREGYANDD